LPAEVGLYTGTGIGSSITTGSVLGPLAPDIVVPQYLQLVVPTTCLAPQCGHTTFPSFVLGEGLGTGAGVGLGLGVGFGMGVGLGGMGLLLLIGVPQNLQNAASFS